MLASGRRRRSRAMREQETNPRRTKFRQRKVCLNRVIAQVDSAEQPAEEVPERGPGHAESSKPTPFACTRTSASASDPTAGRVAPAINEIRSLGARWLTILQHESQRPRRYQFGHASGNSRPRTLTCAQRQPNRRPPSVRTSENTDPL